MGLTEENSCGGPIIKLNGKNYMCVCLNPFLDSKWSNKCISFVMMHFLILNKCFYRQLLAKFQVVNCNSSLWCKEQEHIQGGGLID